MFCELRSAGVVLLGAPAGRKRAQALTVEGRLMSDLHTLHCAFQVLVGKTLDLGELQTPIELQARMCRPHRPSVKRFCTPKRAPQTPALQPSIDPPSIPDIRQFQIHNDSEHSLRNRSRPASKTPQRNPHQSPQTTSGIQPSYNNL